MKSDLDMVGRPEEAVERPHHPRSTARRILALLLVLTLISLALVVAGCWWSARPSPGGTDVGGNTGGTPGGGTGGLTRPPSTGPTYTSPGAPTTGSLPGPGQVPSPQLVYPPEVMAVYEAIKPVYLATAVATQDETFFLFSLGTQNKAGASVRITGVRTDGAKAVVTVEVKEATGAAVDAPYYPIAVETAKGKFTDVTFQRTDDYFVSQLLPDGGGRFPSSLYALASSPSIRVTAVGRDLARVVVAGIARVFEGTVTWELRDSDGKSLAKGFVTTAGAPSWGYFEVDVPNPPRDAVTMVVYWDSPKDGAVSEPVEVRVPGTLLDIWPQEVRSLVDLIQSADLGPVGASLVVGDKTYLVASSGRQVKLGAGVIVAGAGYQDGAAYPTAAFTGPTSVKAAAPYTPVDVWAVDGQFGASYFETLGHGYLPSLVGLPSAATGTPLKQSGDLVVTAYTFDPKTATAKVYGIGRIWEAQFQWELQDAKAKVLKSGPARTVIGAADWGYFELSVDGIPAEATKLVLFDVSGKGDRTSELPLELKR
ncbi:MAG: Gmad2 immunoglobulin-like domain-containing protein [Bacillota bacterium]